VLESIKSTPSSRPKAPKRCRIDPSTGAPIPVGISKAYGGKWQARISHGGKTRTIAFFDTLEEASKALHDVKKMLAEKSQGTEGDAADHFEWAKAEWAKAEAMKVIAEGGLEAEIAALAESYVCMINFLR
jgi:hypothetical protein